MNEPNELTEFDNLLQDDGPVALIIKQPLAPVDDEDPVIFPPTYPITMFKSRVHTIRDGDYRVSVELPPVTKADQNQKEGNQQPGYNIDRFPDDKNSCEIDSPQSQSNRIEPKFKKIKGGKLVPQIDIRVGSESVNLLDAGHRAADAVVRMSSMADKLHAAFVAAKSRNYFELAKYAPTSLIFGVWDSRSTYEKRQRILKAQIRATNFLERSKSAQYTPAVDYIGTSAVGEEVEKEEAGTNNLSAEGMKHALSTQTVGGVMLTLKSKLVRTVNVNLAAIRELRGATDPQTKALQNYILGLALVAATLEPDLNLREGCNLRFKGDQSLKFVYRNSPDKPGTLKQQTVENFAETTARAFFALAGIAFDKKDHPDAIFETSVAEDFLSMSKADRDKVSRLGPITAATLKLFEEQGKDPFKQVNEAIKTVKNKLGKAPKKNQPPVKNPNALLELTNALKAISENITLPDEAQSLAKRLLAVSENHDDSHAAIKEIGKGIKNFKRAGNTGSTSTVNPTAAAAAT